MSATAGVPPFLAAWLEAQQAFARLSVATIPSGPAARPAQPSFTELYRPLFVLPGLPSIGADAARTGESMQRYQRAAATVGGLLNEAAADAGRRFGAALADDRPDAVPITSLRELQTLWIDCGEAAWSAVAHREEFAVAQAELLAAWAMLRATGKGA